MKTLRPFASRGGFFPQQDGLQKNHCSSFGLIALTLRFGCPWSVYHIDVSLPTKLALATGTCPRVTSASPPSQPPDPAPAAGPGGGAVPDPPCSTRTSPWVQRSPRRAVASAATVGTTAGRRLSVPPRTAKAAVTGEKCPSGEMPDSPPCSFGAVTLPLPGQPGPGRGAGG